MTANNDTQMKNVEALNDDGGTHRAIVVIPTFDDWSALSEVLRLIEAECFSPTYEIGILIVDDCSSRKMPNRLVEQCSALRIPTHTLRLLRNLGHQRAIAVALCYIHDHFSCDSVVVMDGDGEDDPADIATLLRLNEAQEGTAIVFARRSRRSESAMFKMFYALYKGFFFLLTGMNIGVGNFSLIPAPMLRNIVVISEVWNHYSSAIFRSRLPYVEVDIRRGRRLSGKGKMNLISLVTHGLSSVAVHGDVVGTRLLLTTAFFLLIICIALGMVIAIRLLTDWAIPGWATYSSGLLLITACQFLLLGMVFSMIILSTRNATSFIPIRDYSYYIDRLISHG